MRFLSIVALSSLALPAFAEPPSAVKPMPTDMVLCQRSVVTWAANYINGSEAKGILENGFQLVQCSNAPAAEIPKPIEHIPPK